MYLERRALYQTLEASRDSRVIAYITGDRQNLEVQIGGDTLDFFVNHLDTIGVTSKISLYLYTRGGDTLAAWSLVNLLRSFCDELEVIVPSKAQSAGTLIALGADRLVMTKQASLGPIDPSVNSPLNPPIEGAPPQIRMPVNVENVNAYLDFAKEALGPDRNLDSAFIHLAQSIHPMVLGQAFRSRAQIRQLARALLSNHLGESSAIPKILDFLCSESGSHDYTVNRREAKGSLGLPVEKPSQALYEVIKQVYDDFAAELELTVPYDPVRHLAGQPQGQYNLRRGFIESVDGGSDVFSSEGVLTAHQVPGPQGVQQHAIHDQRRFEGWRHNAPPS